MEPKLKSGFELLQKAKEVGLLPSSQPEIPEVPQLGAKPSVRPTPPPVEVGREDYKPRTFPNPALYLQALYPKLELNTWQFEILMAFAGYLDPRKYTDLRAKPDMVWDMHNTLQLALSICNGGGKDRVIIGGCAAWQMVTFKSARAIITSASHAQLRSQTEPHIRAAAERHNQLFTKTFDSVHYRHSVPANGSQIEMFCTDDPDLAEGYHPWDDGPMSLWFNEAKSIAEPVLTAADRWTGFSHWIYISSGGSRSGSFYDSFSKAREAGREMPKASPSPNQFYCRQITQFDCPHIPRHHLNSVIEKYGINHPLVQSMVFSNFTDFVEGSLITPEDLAMSNGVQSAGNDIGIGWDFAAGGDENAIVVRRGNRVIYQKFWREPDTTKGVIQFDEFTRPWKHQPYLLNADNGGLGVGFIDNLKNMGWNIRRRNNQSAPNNPALYTNLGAEVYGHVRRLLQTGHICLDGVDPKLLRQLLARKVRGSESTQGRVGLLSKKEQKAESGESPDRSDAFCLAFYSHKPSFKVHTPEVPDPLEGFIPLEQWLAEVRRRNRTQELAYGESRSLFV